MKNQTKHMVVCWLGCAALVVGCLGPVRSATAQGNATRPQTAAPATNPPPTVATPAPKWAGPNTADGFDWIELTSGEWLKGEIKVLHDDKLEFDSDKLDLLKLDWEDVKQVVTKRTHTARSVNKEEFAGSLQIDEREVRITGKSGTTQAFARDDLLGIVQGAPKEINYWSFKFGAGATFQTGNTKKSDMNLSADIQRRTANSRFSFNYLGIQTATDEIETANNHRINSAFDLFMTRRLFLRPVFAEYYRDRFQNIEHQGTVGLGIGYHLIDTSKTEWDIFGGPAYEYTRFVSVLPGERPDSSTPALVAGLKYKTELTSWMDAEAGYNFSLVNQQSGTYKHHATAGLSIELTRLLDLELSVVWDRIQRPQSRSDGSVPLSDDFRFLFGVAIDF